MRELDAVLGRTGYETSHFQTSWGRPMTGEVRMVAHDDCSVISLRSNASITGTGSRDMLKSTFAFNTGKNTIYWKNQPVGRNDIAGFNLAEEASHYRLESASKLVAVFFRRSAVTASIEQLGYEDVLETMEGSNHVRCNEQQLDDFKRLVLARLSSGAMVAPRQGGDPLLQAILLLRDCEQRNQALGDGRSHIHPSIMRECVKAARSVANNQNSWVVPTVDEFRRSCGYGASSVNNACHDLYGMPAKRVLIGIRMENAIELLTNPIRANQLGCGSSVRQIADFLGTTVRTLGENMKEYWNRSPAWVKEEGQKRKKIMTA